MALLEIVRAEGVAPLTPQIVLPVQLLGRSPLGLLPERRLMLAVLEDAVWELLRARRPGPETQRLVAEAEAWIAADDTTGPFAFVNVCQALDLEVETVRAAVMRQRRAVAASGADGARARATPFRRMTGGHGVVTPRGRSRARRGSPRG